VTGQSSIRLDRLLVNIQWWLMFKEASVYHLPQLKIRPHSYFNEVGAQWDAQQAAETIVIFVFMDIA